jgi:hypothetical protein
MLDVGLRVITIQQTLDIIAECMFGRVWCLRVRAHEEVLTITRWHLHTRRRLNHLFIRSLTTSLRPTSEVQELMKHRKKGVAPACLDR